MIRDPKEPNHKIGCIRYIIGVKIFKTNLNKNKKKEILTNKA